MELSKDILLNDQADGDKQTAIQTYCYTERQHTDRLLYRETARQRQEEEDKHTNSYADRQSEAYRQISWYPLLVC